MNLTVKTLLALATTAVAWPAAAQLTLYEHDGFTGRSWRTSAAVRNLDNRGFNDRASSVLVARGRWEVCENNNFSGRCRVLRAGRYPSLSDMGLNDRVSSVRAVGTRQRVQDERYAPLPVVQQDFRRRDGERLYQARVSSAHAVMGPPEQRCWVERTQVQGQRSSNLPGAVAGALIGGILGHQIGGGTGRDIATVGGVVAGAAVGSRVGGGGSSQPQDVQRCTSVRGDARIDHWDVGYTYRGMAHQVQMAGDPGRTVTVNRYGEPRE
jgi:uncharacterized protein YcfJ